MSNLDPILRSYVSSPNSLFGLLARYRVIVPGIQRHYVQGADNLHAKEVRIRFVRDIVKSIKERSPLCLDFIYGPIETAGADAFTPVDGQQRLTTIWLAARYFSETLADEDRLPILSLLSRFSYEDRIHATRFCHELTAPKNRFGHERSPSEAILRKEWFTPFWIKDSTVSAMLNTLDTIHDVCTKEFHNPIDPCQALEHIGTRLTFQLCVDSFGQDIYMKMNARGLTLTQWENFKGRFAKMLGADEAKRWQESVEHHSNLFFTEAQKHRTDASQNCLPDAPFLALIARIMVYAAGAFEKCKGQAITRLADHNNWVKELPYVPYSEFEELANSLKDSSMLAACVTGFLNLLDYLLEKGNDAVCTMSSPYWQDKKTLFEVVFWPVNENERHFSLMLFEYLRKHKGANSETFARAVRFMWNTLANVSGSYSRVRAVAACFETADVYSTLGNTAFVMQSEDVQYKEEREKAKQYYALNDRDSIALLNQAEVMMHGRVRLALLDLKTNYKCDVPIAKQGERLTTLVALQGTYAKAKESDDTRRRLMLLVVAAEPLGLKDSLALHTKDEHLREVLSTRDDAFLQQTLIDYLCGKSPQSIEPAALLRANPSQLPNTDTNKWMRDWRQSILTLTENTPERVWDRSVEWHRSSDHYYLYCGQTIRNALPISDWRIDLLMSELLSELYKCFVANGEICMNDNVTRSVHYPERSDSKVMVYFWRHELEVRKSNVMQERIPIDTNDIACILGKLKTSCMKHAVNCSEH